MAINQSTTVLRFGEPVIEITVPFVPPPAPDVGCTTSAPQLAGVTSAITASGGTLTSPQQYFYFIVALDAGNLRSSVLQPVEVDVNTGSTNQITLTGTSASMFDANATQYEVYRSAGTPQQPQRIAGPTAVPSGAFSFTDTGLALQAVLAPDDALIAVRVYWRKSGDVTWRLGAETQGRTQTSLTFVVPFNVQGQVIEIQLRSVGAGGWETPPSIAALSPDTTYTVQPVMPSAWHFSGGSDEFGFNDTGTFFDNYDFAASAMRERWDIANHRRGILGTPSFALDLFSSVMQMSGFAPASFINDLNSGGHVYCLGNGLSAAGSSTLRDVTTTTDRWTVNSSGNFGLKSVPTTDPFSIAGIGVIDSNSQLKGSFRNNPVNVACTPSIQPLSQSGTSTTINVASFTNQYGSGTVSYNSGSVNPGAYGTYYVYCDDATFAGGAVAFQATTSNPTVNAAEGRVYLGKITTVSGGGGTGSGGGSGGCFSRNVQIQTRRGLVRMDEVQAGDEVLTRSGYHHVTAVLEHSFRGSLRDMGAGNLVTSEHRLFINGEWQPAGRFFDAAVGFQGPIYNLEVEDEHEYVLESGLVAHNVFK